MKTNKLALIGILGAVLLGPQESRARSGFFETIGVSTAVGIVLGASTLPFYEHPFSHSKNMTIGAAIGAAFGLGYLAYGKFIKASDQDMASQENFYQPSFVIIEQQGVSFCPGSLAQLRVDVSQYRASTYSSKSVLSTNAWMPLVSLRW